MVFSRLDRRDKKNEWPIIQTPFCQHVAGCGTVIGLAEIRIQMNHFDPIFRNIAPSMRATFTRSREVAAEFTR